MNKTTKSAATHLINGENWGGGNTTVHGNQMMLFGNIIAKIEGHELWVNKAGWPTLTTHERLNGLCEMWCGARPFNSKDGHPKEGWIRIGLRVK